MDTLQVSDISKKKATANKEKPMSDSMIENEIHCIFSDFALD